jgi:radical SAM protein with 4Fe4S-binding SPASM domain
MLNRDTRQILRLITPIRAWNLMQLRFSYYYSRIIRKPWMWGKPFSISIEPTTACNLGCPECPSGLRQFTRDTGNLKEDLNLSLLKAFGKRLMYINYYFQGEPFINPSFLAMVEQAAKRGIYTATSTNAHFLHDQLARRTVESGLHRLIISIDGTTQDTYEQYRVNGKLDKVLEGTRNIVRWKEELNSATPHVIFQFLVVKPNEHQVQEVFALARSLGVNEVRLKTAQFYNYENGNPLMPENEQYSRYVKGRDGKYRLKNRMRNHCWRMWQGCVVTWDGKVVPCCFDKDALHQLGSLSDNALHTIWHGAPYRQFRQAVLRSRKSIDICSNCSEGSQVWS